MRRNFDSPLLRITFATIAALSAAAFVPSSTFAQGKVENSTVQDGGRKFTDKAERVYDGGQRFPLAAERVFEPADPESDIKPGLNSTLFSAVAALDRALSDTSRPRRP